MGLFNCVIIFPVVLFLIVVYSGIMINIIQSKGYFLATSFLVATILIFMLVFILKSR